MTRDKKYGNGECFNELWSIVKANFLMHVNGVVSTQVTFAYGSANNKILIKSSGGGAVKAGIGFYNGSTATGAIGVDYNSGSPYLYWSPSGESGSSFYKIWHENNSNKSSVPWACSTLTAASNITSTSGNVAASAGGVSAAGIASLAISSLSSVGAVTSIKINSTTYTPTDGLVSLTFATVASSGSYNDLSNKPTIPTESSLLSSGFAMNYAVTSSTPSGTSYTVQTYSARPTYEVVSKNGSSLQLRFTAPSGQTKYYGFYRVIVVRNTSSGNMSITFSGLNDAVKPASSLSIAAGTSIEIRVFEPSSSLPAIVTWSGQLS